MTWYGVFRGLMRGFVHAVARVDAVGTANIPSEGPFILVANHQSILDPIFVQVVCRRHLHTFTKSTKFAGRFFGWLMPRLKAIPTRRFRVDPQVIRVALRTLDRGEAVGIYPEGERSWDSGLQPFRRGTIRLLLKAGVPVVPCGIVGTYDVWPRWSGGIRRRRVRVSFGTPLRWPAMHTRREREEVFVEAEAALRASLAQLSAWESVPGSQSVQEAEEGAEPTWLRTLLD